MFDVRPGEYITAHRLNDELPDATEYSDQQQGRSAEVHVAKRVLEQVVQHS